MGGKQSVVEENAPASPRSPSSPRVVPVDGDEMPLPELLDKEASQADEALTPKTSGRVTVHNEDDDGAASPLDDEPGRAASQRSSGRRGDEKKPEASESRAPGRALVLTGHTGEVDCLAALDGNRLASGGRDSSIIIWNLADGSQLAKLEGHTFDVRCLAALGGDRLASGGSCVIIWNVVTARSATLEGHTQWVNCLAALDGGRLASGSDDKTIIIWNLADCKQFKKLEGHKGVVHCLATLDGGRLASGSWDKSIIIWNLADGAPLVIFKAHTGPVRCLAAIDGGRLASGGDDNTIRIWNLVDCAQLAKLRVEEHTRGVRCLAALDSGRLASCGYDNTIRIWNVAVNDPDDKKHVKILGEKGGIRCLGALDDGRLASGGGDGTIRVGPMSAFLATSRIAKCSSAFDFEEVARGCRDNNMLDDLLDAVDHHISNSADASKAISLQAHVFDAIAKVVNEEEDESREKLIESLAPRVLDLVLDDDLLSAMQRRGVSHAAIEKLASTAIFRAVVDGKLADGLWTLFYFKSIYFLVLMFCFGRVAGIEVLEWPKWFAGEENFEIVVAFIMLAHFTGSEIREMMYMRGIELATPGDPFKGAESLESLWALLIPRLLVFSVVCLLLSPVILVWIGLWCADKEYEWMDAFFDWFGKTIIDAILHDPLTFLGLPRAWRRDHWNWTDVAMLACCWAAFVRAAMPGTRMGTNLAVATSMLLWIKVLAFLKNTTMDLATFVAVMIDRIVLDLSSFLIFFLVIIMMFACALYLYLGPRTRGDYDFHDDGAPTGYTTFPKTMLSLYLLGFIGEFDWDTFDTYALRALLCLFIFIVVIVLLNVLIAIVGESYANARQDNTRVGIYYRLKIELIAEMAPGARSLQFLRSLHLYSLWRFKDETRIGEETIRNMLLEELDQDKVQAEADPVRESEERTKQKLNAVERELAETRRQITDMAATQQQILEMLQSIRADQSS